MSNPSSPANTGASRSGRRKARAERDSLAQVLCLIRDSGAATRQEVERSSGLSRAVVVDRLATLTERGLVEEGELGESTGGRAPRRVRFKATAGHVLTASLGTTTLSVGLADLSGRLLFEHHELADFALGAEQALDRVEELFDWMLEEHTAVSEAWGIGLALPGVVESTNGRLESHPILRLPGWDDYPAEERLSKKYGAPVLVENKVHMMALGELRAGRGMDSDDLVFVKIGTGISAGLCLDGRLYRGAHGCAGDIGHVAVSDEDGVVCRCGNTGCLETLASGAVIAREGQLGAEGRRSGYLEEVIASGRSVTSADVGMAAQRGDPFCIELLSRSGRLVGATLATVVAAHNPSLVIIGGGVAQAGEILVAAIREALYRRSRSLATRDLHIVRSEMGKTAALVGATLAVTDELFSWDYLRSWIDVGSPARLFGSRLGEDKPSRKPPVLGQPRRPGPLGQRDDPGQTASGT